MGLAAAADGDCSLLIRDDDVATPASGSNAALGRFRMRPDVDAFVEAAGAGSGDDAGNGSGSDSGGSRTLSSSSHFLLECCTGICSRLSVSPGSANAALPATDAVCLVGGSEDRLLLLLKPAAMSRAAKACLASRIRSSDLGIVIIVCNYTALSRTLRKMVGLSRLFWPSRSVMITQRQEAPTTAYAILV